jgi:hypothetical protein
MTQPQKIWKALDATCHKYDYAGWDPFDGLNSKLFQATPLARSKWLKLAWLQFFKRSPVNFRPLTWVPRTHNAKALSLFTRSYLLQGDEEKARYCLEKMLDLRSPQNEWGSSAWGYPFYWQAKAFFVAKGVPNVICTLYGTLALEAAESAGLIGDATDHILASADFVSKHLMRNNEQGHYIAYVPNADALVHNASLWGAYLLIAAYARNQDASLKEKAEKVIQTSLDSQAEDGHWRYGTMPHHQFIDGFHTGYNLEALYRINQTLKREDISHAIAKGLSYYKENFFDAEGRAFYYHNNPYPLDPHSTAQAVLTLRLIDPENTQELRNRLMSWVCDNMWDSANEHFHYQHIQRYQNRQNYLRWTQAWMHLALSDSLQEK